jgi:hypothetical protein
MRTRRVSSLGFRSSYAGRLAIAAALVVACFVGAARAESRAVAVVHSQETDEVLSEAATRLRGELVAAGFDVRELVIAEGSDPKEQVDAAGLSPTPVATIAINKDDDTASLDVWVTDRATHEMVVRHLDAAGVNRKRAPAVLAVRAVELLRASLLPASERKKPVPTEQPPKKATPPKPPPKNESGEVPERRTAAEDRPGFRGEVGVAMLYASPGITAAFAPLLRLDFGNRTWSGRASLVAPAFGGEASAAGGSAALREEMLTLGFTVRWPAEGTFAIVGSAAAGGFHIHVSGRGSSPNVGLDADQWGGMVETGGGVILRFGPRSGLLLDTQAYWLLPPVIVQIAGVDAGRSGRPALSSSLGVWVAL